MTDVMSKKSLVGSNMPISVRSFPELTEGQKACLRLVGQHHTSKEIARKLGISPFTVDQRLDAARRKLDASSRREAAMIFAKIEMHAISQPLVYEAHPLEPTDFAASQRSTPISDNTAKVFSFFSRSPNGGRWRDLSTRETAVRALIVAFCGSLVMAFIVSV